MYVPRLSIRARIWILTLGFLGVFACTGGVVALVQSVMSARAKESLSRVELVRKCQVHFKLQVQEWKNILIRGADGEAYAKHLVAFKKEAGSVQSLLKELGDHSPEAQTKARAAEIARSHADLLKRYEDTLLDIPPGSADFTRAADRRLKGMDRPTDEQLEALVEAIARQSAESDTADRRLFWMALAAACAATALFTAGFAFLAVRSVSITIAAITGSLEQISEGKLNLEIDERGKDERAPFLPP